MDICHFCGNKNLKECQVQYTYRHDNKFIIVDDVPCVQCEFCGEQYFKSKVLKKIESEFDAIYTKGKKATKEIIVPFEFYKEIEIGL